nr:hypothetical protein [uncultured Oribacterium sp.]
MWFILSLISIFFWSGSDFFSKLGSPAKDKDSHLKMLMVVGLVMGAHATSQVLFQGVSFTKEILIAYLPVSFLYISSMLLGYIGLRYIELSVSSGSAFLYLSKAGLGTTPAICHPFDSIRHLPAFLSAKKA